MGGAISSRKSSKPLAAAADKDNSQNNRRLSVAGDKKNFPVAEKGVVGQTLDRGSHAFLNYFSMSNAGYEPDGIKKTNQDAFISMMEFGDPSVSFFGVFDGHGASGHFVSGYVKKELPKLIDKEILKQESQKNDVDEDLVGKILIQAFEKINNKLESDKSIDSSLSGTTAVGGFILGKNPKSRTIVMANSGDSRAIIGYEKGGKYLAAELSIDQKPDRPDEKSRIISCGGRVEPLMDENGYAIGPHRVWLPNMMLPGLAMARSIGDDIASSVGVQATPEIMTYKIEEKDKFMVIASDGVWEFLSNEQVVEIVKGCQGNPEKAASELCSRSLRCWKAEEEVVDDITALVVYFKH
mmetsp:Transcript_11302/g.38613  ORF Transcript_11302/g.38613 Transcript_11302/m.38613 type:complete len:353 (-) Transcript_11302:1078-2136(-)